MKDTKNSVAVCDSDIMEAQNRARTFDEAGFNVVSVESDGTTFLKDIQKKRPDLIIMDLILPGIDGLGIIESILEENVFEYCPTIIVISRISIDEQIAEAVRLGVDYYMMKPVSNQLVLRRANQLLQKRNGKYSETVATRENTPPTSSAQSGTGKNTKEELSVTKDVYTDVTEILLKIGIPAHIKGYIYIREAVVMAVQDPSTLHFITKFIYPTIARKFKTTGSSVERTIRHAIEVGWKRGDIEYLNKTFGFTIGPNSDKPTNSEFIALIADKIRLAYRE